MKLSWIKKSIQKPFKLVSSVWFSFNVIPIYNEQTTLYQLIP